MRSELIAFVLFEPEAEVSMAQWVRDDIVDTAMSDVFLHRWYMSTAMEKCESDATTLQSDTNAMQFIVKNAIKQHVSCSSSNHNNKSDKEVHAHNESRVIDTTQDVANNITSKSQGANVLRKDDKSFGTIESTGEEITRLEILLIVIFWDGQSEASKQSFTKLKQLTDEKSVARQELNSILYAHHTTLHLTIQALNAKKGAHTVRESRDALISTLYKKLDVITDVAKRREEVKRVMHIKEKGLSALSDGKETCTNVSEENIAHGINNNNNNNKAGKGSSLEEEQQININSHSTHEEDKNTSISTTIKDNEYGNSIDTVNTNTSGKEIHDATLNKEHITKIIEDGQGESFFVLMASTQDKLVHKIDELRALCAELEIGMCPLTPEPRLVNTTASAIQGKIQASSPHTSHDSSGSINNQSNSVTSSSSSNTNNMINVFAQEFLLRRWVSGHHMELRLAMCGNVDSGKSTLTSVMTRGCHDDGRGFARAFVFNHKHEAATGRTSSISENHLGFTPDGEVANYMVGNAVCRAFGVNKQQIQSVAATKEHSENGTNAMATSTTIRQYTPQELAKHSAKVFTLYDLAGHERYLKTTVLGMTRNMPDYACVVISANNGIQRMTKEHIALCLALKLPFFVVITRIDATPANVFAETKNNINKILKIPTVRKLPYPVRRTEELIMAAKNLQHDRITPIFEVSNVTGEGIDSVLKFLNLLPMRKDWRVARALPREMIIDTTFFVTGVGTVVGGVVTQGVFKVNDTVLLGPDSFGHFRPVTIKSIHVKGVESSEAEAGNDAAFCLKKERRSAIRKGNILADPRAPPTAYWQFEAEVTILYHSTTISVNYEPVIHSNTVRQSARIVYVAKEVLRTGDHSLVRFHFLYRPEFMKEGQRLIFREGRTKGIGTVTKLFSIPDETLLKTAKARRKYPLTLPSSNSTTATGTTTSANVGNNNSNNTTTNASNAHGELRKTK